MTNPIYPSLLNDSFRKQWDRLLHLHSLGFRPRAILDIGAYHGGWSILAAALWPDAFVHSIEANEACREKLAAHVQSFEIAALSDSTGPATYWKCTEKSTEGNSFYTENTRHPFVPVLMHTKTLAECAGGRTFDLIKIDCQGAELKIIEGGVSVVEKAEFVLLETQLQDYNQGAPRIDEVMRAMDAHGFRLYDIIEIHHNPQGLTLQADLLFARKESPVFSIRPL